MTLEQAKKLNDNELEKKQLNILRNRALSKLEDFNSALNLYRALPKEGLHKNIVDYLEQWGIPTGKEFIAHMGYDKEEGSQGEPSGVNEVIARIKGYEEELENRAYEYLQQGETGKAIKIYQYAFPAVDAFIRSMGADKIMGREIRSEHVIDIIESINNFKNQQ